MKIDCLICSHSSGSSKKKRQAAICVVNKKGLMLSNIGTSKVPIMVKTKMMPMVDTIGPIELSEKHESVIESVATITNDKKAMNKPQ